MHCRSQVIVYVGDMLSQSSAITAEQVVVCAGQSCRRGHTSGREPLPLLDRRSGDGDQAFLPLRVSTPELLRHAGERKGGRFAEGQVRGTRGEGTATDDGLTAGGPRRTRRYAKTDSGQRLNNERVTGEGRGGRGLRARLPKGRGRARPYWPAAEGMSPGWAGNTLCRYCSQRSGSQSPKAGGREPWVARRWGSSLFLPSVLLYGSQLQNSCDMPASGRGAASRRDEGEVRGTRERPRQQPRQAATTIAARGPLSRPWPFLTPEGCFPSPTRIAKTRLKAPDDGPCSTAGGVLDPGCCSLTAGQCPHGGTVRAITPPVHSSITPASPIQPRG